MLQLTGHPGHFQAHQVINHGQREQFLPNSVRRLRAQRLQPFQGVRVQFVEPRFEFPRWW